MAGGDPAPPDEPGDPGQSLTDTEREALHATGHGMDHLAAAEDLLREAGWTDLADEIRDRHLPRGVTDTDRWSYAVLEGFQDGVLADVERFEGRARCDRRRSAPRRRTPPGTRVARTRRELTADSRLQ